MVRNVVGVGIYGSVSRRFITRAVLQSEEFAVELGEGSDIGGV